MSHLDIIRDSLSWISENWTTSRLDLLRIAAAKKRCGCKRNKAGLIIASVKGKVLQTENYCSYAVGQHSDDDDCIIRRNAAIF